MPEFFVEDERSSWLPDDDGGTVLEYLGCWYTPRALAPWQDQGAVVVRYSAMGERTIVGAVDDILSGRIRPPIERDEP